MHIHKASCCCLLFLVLLTCYAQDTVTGNVYSASDSTALSGVSIYFDGTSIGTTTNSKGFFKIQTIPGNNTPLIIRFMGYENLMITNIPEGTERFPSFYLKEKAEELAEVIIEPDSWSREKKLTVFRREFLGATPEAEHCRIKNEETLRLHYSPSTETLTAAATEPLLIVNRFLGYEIEYSLVSFRAEFFTGTTGLRFTELVYYEGYSFFRDLKEPVKRKFIKNRKETYLGSSLHFMRSLAREKLESNGFRIFHGKSEVAPYKYFETKDLGGQLEVKLLAEKLSILYDGLEQSAIHAKAPFIVQQFGNPSPPHLVMFSGKMSKSRIAHLLPLDYDLEN